MIIDNLTQKVLNKKQLNLIPVVDEFAKTHLLMWWTAISLILWHRESIDFDFFSFWKQWTWKEIFDRIKKTWFQLDYNLTPKFYLSDEEIIKAIFYIDWIKFQLIDFSIREVWQPLILKCTNIEKWLPTVDLLTHGSFKLNAISYRNKWKDAIDLYFIIKRLKIKKEDLIKHTYDIFGKDFFFYEDMYENIISRSLYNKWDKEEKINWCISDPPSDKEICDFLYNYFKDF